LKASISVIIPAYNAGKFIARALASVENQTCPVYEVVVVDDGSTDDTYMRANEFARTSKLNLIIEQQDNHGSATARNHGIRRSSGDLIAFMDADDLMYPDFLEQTTTGLNLYPHWVACFSDRDVVDAHGKLLAKDLDHPKFLAISKNDMGQGFFELADDALFSKILPGSVIPMTIVCRRSAVKAVRGFDEAIRFHEDRLFLLELIKLGGKLGYTTNSLGIWQRHDANKTGAGNSLKGIESSDSILGKVLADKIRLNLSPQELTDVHSARRHLARGWIYAASCARSATTFSLGRRLLSERRITLWCFMKAIARYAVAIVRG
jgi:glycosyltransferase involved in cell wall biosynthesis